MKKIIGLLTLIISFQLVNAQNDKYVKAMEGRLAAIDTTHSTAGLQSLSDAFSRIGDAEKTQWLPYYYAALCLTNAGWSDPSVDKDANAAKIKMLCDKAATINDNAEIYAIRNMAATQQMLVDPQNRWNTNGAEAEASMKKGLELEPENPRLLFLQAASVFGTPEQFGGGKEKAKPLLEKAIAAFNAEKPQKLSPTWGKQQAEQMLQQTK